MTYSEYLRSDHWKKLRQSKITAAFERCEQCGTPSRLEVHHLNYRDLYSCTLDDLKVLCNWCHERAHGLPIGRPVSQWLKNKIAQFHSPEAREKRRRKRFNWIAKQKRKKEEKIQDHKNPPHGGKYADWMKRCHYPQRSNRL